MSFWRPVSDGTSLTSFSASAASRRQPTSDFSGCSLDPPRVPDHVGDREGDEHEPHHDPQADPVADGDPGRIRGDAGGERVDRRGDHPVPAPRKMIAAATIRS